MLSSFARNWHVPKNIDLRKLLDPSRSYSKTCEVRLDMTTNRTGKKGDDILCTPGLIDEMGLLACGAVNSATGKSFSSVTKKIYVRHKRPLKYRKEFELTAVPKEIKPTTAVFNIKGIDKENGIEIGCGEVTVEVIKYE